MSSARPAPAHTSAFPLSPRQNAQPTRVGPQKGARHTPFPERLAVRRLTGGGPRGR